LLIFISKIEEKKITKLDKNPLVGKKFSLIDRLVVNARNEDLGK